MVHSKWALGFFLVPKDLSALRVRTNTFFRCFKYSTSDFYLYCVSFFLVTLAGDGKEQSEPESGLSRRGQPQTEHDVWVDSVWTLLWVQGCDCISFAPPDNSGDFYSPKYCVWSRSSSFSFSHLNSQFVFASAGCFPTSLGWNSCSVFQVMELDRSVWMTFKQWKTKYEHYTGEKL